MNRIKVMLRERWIPGLFVLGFLVVIAVNTVLIVTATGSFSGLVVAHPYKKGSEFNRLQNELAEQKALHWSYTLHQERRAGGDLRLVLDWRDAQGLTLNGLALNAELSRPVENLAALPVTFIPIGGGRYEARLTVPRAGLWDLRANASLDGHDFTLAERISIKPEDLLP